MDVIIYDHRRNTTQAFALKEEPEPTLIIIWNGDNSRTDGPFIAISCFLGWISLKEVLKHKMITTKVK